MMTFEHSVRRGYRQRSWAPKASKYPSSSRTLVEFFEPATPYCRHNGAQPARPTGLPSEIQHWNYTALARRVSRFRRLLPRIS
ncbi:hypothetical protein VTI28DRAFT_6897 [Corynascus sepedonium]